METRGSIAAAAAGTKPSSAGASPVSQPRGELVIGAQEVSEPMIETVTTAAASTNDAMIQGPTPGLQQEDVHQPSLPPLLAAKTKKRAAKDAQDTATEPGPRKRPKKKKSKDSSTASNLEPKLSSTKEKAPPKNNIEAWKEKFELLCAFQRENGHCRVPKNLVVESVKLGEWVKEQRRFYRNYLDKKKVSSTTINEERIAQLKSIGLEWNCNLKTRTIRDDEWQRKLELLIAFRRENGHFRVPHDFVVDSIKLGQWVKNQRKFYKNRMAGKTGLRASITEERISQLNAIGFHWKYNGMKEWRKDDDGWQKKFEHLCAFQRERGHCRVPNKFVVDSIKLGLWVDNQRRYFKNFKKGKRGNGASITEERISKLDSIGFEWKCHEKKESKMDGDGLQQELGLLNAVERENEPCQIQNA